MEAHDLSSWLSSRIRNSTPPKALKQAIRDYQIYGGLPGVFHIRNTKLRTQRIYDQLQTILDRDLREVISTRLSSSEIFDFAHALAKQEGVPFSYTQLLRESEVTPVSAKKLLSALESVFLIRLLKIEGGKKGFIFYFEDQAESRYFSSGTLDPSIYYSGFLYRSIRAEFAYAREHHFHFFHYLTRHNTTLPFAVAWNGKYLGFLPLQAPKPSHAEIMAAQSFLKRYNDAKVMMIHPSAKPIALSERVVLLPDFLLF
jgi:hypothetical protein